MSDTWVKGKRDWYDWHQQYTDQSSALRRRLAIIQEEIRRTLPLQLDRSFSMLSICAGQGDDLIPVLEGYSFSHRIRARFVEAEPRNIASLRRNAYLADLHHLEVVQADASYPKVYDGMIPADLILLCGVFGNISDLDIQDTISSLQQLCRTGSRVIWTRSRRSPNIVPTIRQWFQDSEFQEITFAAPEDALFTVGTHEFRGQRKPLSVRKLFTFLV